MFVSAEPALQMSRQCPTETFQLPTPRSAPGLSASEVCRRPEKLKSCKTDFRGPQIPRIPGFHPPRKTLPGTPDDPGSGDKIGAIRIQRFDGRVIASTRDVEFFQGTGATWFVSRDSRQSDQVAVGLASPEALDQDSSLLMFF